MLNEEMVNLFRKNLESCLDKKKYKGKFELEDKKRAANTFETVLESTSLTENIIFEILTGEKSK